MYNRLNNPLRINWYIDIRCFPATVTVYISVRKSILVCLICTSRHCVPQCHKTHWYALSHTNRTVTGKHPSQYISSFLVGYLVCYTFYFLLSMF